MQPTLSAAPAFNACAGSFPWRSERRRSRLNAACDGRAAPGPRESRDASGAGPGRGLEPARDCVLAAAARPHHDAPCRSADGSNTIATALPTRRTRAIVEVTGSPMVGARRSCLHFGAVHQPDRRGLTARSFCCSAVDQLHARASSAARASPSTPAVDDGVALRHRQMSAPRRPGAASTSSTRRPGEVPPLRRSRRSAAHRLNAAAPVTWPPVDRVRSSVHSSPTTCSRSLLAFGASVIFVLTGSPDRVSTLSGPGTMSRIRPVIQGRPAGGASHAIVPVSCRLSRPPAFSFSIIRFPAERHRASPLATRLTGQRPSARTSTGYRVPHAPARPAGRTLIRPRTYGARPAGSPPRPAPAASQRQVLRSRQQQAIERTPTSTPRGSRIHSSGLPLAHAAGMEPAALSAPKPPSFSSCRHRQRTSRVGTGHRARTWNYRSTHIRRSPIR